MRWADKRVDSAQEGFSVSSFFFLIFLSLSFLLSSFNSKFKFPVQFKFHSKIQILLMHELQFFLYLLICYFTSFN
jgi:hypothetical protein